jgi:uncharacterized protein
MHAFRWNAWNVEHIAEHGIRPGDAEVIVDRAQRPWPEKIGYGKWRVWGQTPTGNFLQVIYVFSPEDVGFVIHAMRLNETQKRQYRRRTR